MGQIILKTLAKNTNPLAQGWMDGSLSYSKLFFTVCEQFYDLDPQTDEIEFKHNSAFSTYLHTLVKEKKLVKPVLSDSNTYKLLQLTTKGRKTVLEGVDF